MEYIKIDFETYYDKDYSLKKMTPVEYILDPRFEVIIMSVKRAGREPFCLEGDQIRQFFQLLNPEKTVLISHNALFDMCIVAWHYNFLPKLFSCTLSMARACLGHVLRSLSLESVAAYLGLGIKGHAVKNMVGLRAADIKAMGKWQEYVDYCNNDSVLCEGIWNYLVGNGHFPANELIVLDMVLRAAIIPQFELDGNALALHHQNIVNDKLNLMNVVGIASGDKSSLMSNPKFAELLIQHGVEPPMKVSPTTGRETYAFSKADKDFTDLEEHPDPMVQALVAARLGVKSTIEETRCERMKNISLLSWPSAFLQRLGLLGGPFAGLMPMPLRYSGAHTHRLSGDWKLNVQNFPARALINHLKRALRARKGHTVLNIDSSQIEARIVAWLCGEHDLMDQFARGLDPYKIFAAKVFGIDTSQVTPEQRFLGKTSILGLGFGLGWVKFKMQVRVKSLEALKISGKGSEIMLTDVESSTIVSTYRSTFPGVPNIWKALNNAIPILAGRGGSYSIGPCKFERGRVSLPNGLYLHYHNLRSTPDGWVYDYGGKPKRLYGGALLENIVQALARIIVMDAATRIKAKIDHLGIRLALQVHDALVYIPPDEYVASLIPIMEQEMNRPVAWAPGLILAAEAHKGPSYGECK